MFALMTWRIDYRFDAVRYFSLPIVGGEAIVVMIAIVGGHLPWKGLARIDRADAAIAAAWLLAALSATLLVTGGFIVAISHFAITSIHVLFGFAIWERLSASWAPYARPMLVASAAGAFAYALLVYGLALSVRGDANFDFLHFGPGVSHVRQLGFYGLVLASLSGGLLATASVRHRPVFFLPLLVGFALVAWSGGRAAFAAAIVAAGLGIALARPSHRRAVLGWTAAAWLLAIPLSMAYVPHRAWGFLRMIGAMNPLDSTMSRFFSNRLEIWTETFRRVLERPLFGHGEGQFRLTIASAQGFFNHPHNWLLQFLFQWGLVGTALVVVLVARRFASTRAALASRPEVAIPSLCALAGLFTMGTLEGPLFHPYPLMSFVLALAVLVAAASTTDRPAKTAE